MRVRMDIKLFLFSTRNEHHKLFMITFDYIGRGERDFRPWKRGKLADQL